MPRIQRLAKEGLQIKLAVSLHAANDEVSFFVSHTLSLSNAGPPSPTQDRNKIMPVNTRFPIKELIQSRPGFSGSGRPKNPLPSP